MKPLVQLQASTATEAWVATADSLLADTQRTTDQDGQECIEFTDATILISNAGDSTLLVQSMRRMLPALYPTIPELHAQTFSRERMGFEWSIGARLFSDVQQLDGFVIPLLRAHPNSRRALAVCYDPHIDSRLDSQAVPAFISIQFRCSEGLLHATAHLRSCDAYLGLPANIWQAWALQEYVARALGLPVGSTTVHIANVHWFTRYSAVGRTIQAQVRRLVLAGLPAAPQEEQRKKAL